MRRHVVANFERRKIAVAWLSFQPDGSISFGLQDRTYISPRMRIRSGIWNAYNRQRATFEIESDPSALEPVRNPHFTYHPPGLFHLKANNDRSNADEDIFNAPARVAVAVDQDGEMDWIRAISNPLASIASGGIRHGGETVEELAINIPLPNASVCIAIDFIRPEAVGFADNLSCWTMPWGTEAIRVTASFTTTRIATLAWFHDR
jgi:hypothetical protein